MSAKINFVIACTCLVIGLKCLTSFSTMVMWSKTNLPYPYPCFEQVTGNCRISDWFIRLSACVVIGRNNYQNFSIDFLSFQNLSVIIVIIIAVIVIRFMTVTWKDRISEKLLSSKINEMRSEGVKMHAWYQLLESSQLLQIHAQQNIAAGHWLLFGQKWWPMTKKLILATHSIILYQEW